MTIYYYTIYKITNKVNNKIYIGQHKTKNLNDCYMGSGSAVERAFKKYGKENFIKQILFIFDNHCDMDNKEKELVTEEFISRYDTYNCKIGGSAGAHSKEVTNKIAESNRGKKHSKETKQKMSESQKGRKHKPRSNESKAKISKARTGKKHSEESKQKMSESQKNRKFSEEHKRKLSVAQKRKKCNPFSEEHRQNISTARSGTICITNGSINKVIPGDSDIPDGFWRGRTMKSAS